MSGDELVYGQHAVAGLLDVDPGRVREVWLQRGRENRLAERLQRRFSGGGVPVHLLPRARLDALLGDVRHQGVAVRVAPAPEVDLRAVIAGLRADTMLVLLDGVQDPRNLGAVLRTADAAGAAAVIYPRSRGTGLTAAARKTASGAAERVPAIAVSNLSQAMGRLADAGVRLLGTAADAGLSLYDADLRGPLGLVLGAEDAGLRRLTRERCEQLVHLPMAGGVSSLNVAVAAGVCLYEVVRRRRAGAARE